MDHLPLHPGTARPAAEAGNVNVEMDQQAAVGQQQLGGGGPNNWAGNDANTLLLVATLITTLSYQIGTNLPGGYWQDDSKDQEGRLVRAGYPIMRDLNIVRYRVFMVASGMGLVSSMLMTLSLLMGKKVESRHVRWPFVVAYSSLILTFVLSGNRMSLHVGVLIWVAVLAFLWLVVSFRQEYCTRIRQVLCCHTP